MASPDDPINAAVAAAITGAYKEMGFTIPELAKRAGISSTTIQRIAAGTVSIKISDLFEIATAVELRPEDLINRAMIRLARLEMSSGTGKPVDLDTERKKKAAAMTAQQIDQARIDRTTPSAATSDEELDSDEPEAP